MQAVSATDIRTVDILLVDDDRTGLLILSRSLERANFSVATANSANDALTLLKTVKPEVIIADVSMPGMDGFEFLRTVRAQGFSDVPFIFCSGRDGALDRILGLRMGADDYLVKPIVPEEVILKVRLQITKVQYLRALKMALEQRNSDSVMSGNFGGMSVIDVLQTGRMLGNGEYAIRLATEEDSGAVYLKDGIVLNAETGWITGTKAFARMLVWERGTFAIENRSYDDEAIISLPLEELMLDQLTQIDESRELRKSIESRGNHFTVHNNGTSLSPHESTICLLVEKFGTLDDVLDNSPLSDRQTAEILLDLLRKEVVQPQQF